MSDDENSLEDIMWHPDDVSLTNPSRQPLRPPPPGPCRHYERLSSTPSPTSLESTSHPNEQQIQTPIALRYHNPHSSVLCDCKCLLHHSGPARERDTYDRDLVINAECTSSVCYFCQQASMSMEASQCVQEPTEHVEDAVRRNSTEPLPTHSAVSTNVEAQIDSITESLSHFQVPGNHMSN